MDGCTVQKVPLLRGHFVHLINYILEKLLNINLQVYNEAVRLFHANMSVPNVPKGTDPILKFNILGAQIEFILSDLYQIVDLPNIGDHCYLTAFDALPVYCRLEFEVYYAISLSGRKPKTATETKSNFRVISKRFSGNVVTRAGHDDYVHLLQSLFLFFLLTDWRINVAYMISFESIHTTYTATSNSSTPNESKPSLPYR